MRTALWIYVHIATQKGYEPAELPRPAWPLESVYNFRAAAHNAATSHPPSMKPGLVDCLALTNRV